MIASQIIRAVSPWLPLAVTVALSNWLLLMVMPVIVSPAVAVVTRISPVELTAAPSAGPVARMMQDGMKLNQVNLDNVTIGKKDGKITVNGANVLGSARGSNGIVYIIDTVLLPPDKK